MIDNDGQRVSDPVYGVVAAFAERLADRGVTEVVISPGSRSTALALCLDAQPLITTWIQLDERSAGFFALGLGRATGRPAVLVCTSGTAAANYLPAVVEAYHAGIPLIACTADRPPELRGWGSPQTIDQVGLYGTAVRWSVDLPVPAEVDPAAGAGWADTAVDRAVGDAPGPVHLNWPLREPLEPLSGVPVAVDAAGTGGSMLPGRSGGGGEILEPSPSAEVSALARLAAEFERGVVVVGPWPGGGLHREQRWAADALRFASWAGWPVIGEPIAHVRGDRRRQRPHPHGRRQVIGEPIAHVRGDAGEESPEACVVATADHLLADMALADQMRPDVAVLAGRTVTTKPVRLWLERVSPAHVVLIDPEDRWQEAVFRLTDHVADSVESLCSTTAPAPSGRSRPGGWLDTWRRIDSAARRALDAAIDHGPLLSARVSHTLARSLPADAVLMASSSMPVRDLDAFVFDTGSLACSANRGAAGIDGTTSTALGIAAANPTSTVALYTGDLALLHDLSGLSAAARLGLHLIAVCVDNDGGEIFSLLPVAERVPPEDFERLFRTPHGLDLLGLDGFAGIRARRVATASELGHAVRAAAAAPTAGVDLLVVAVPRDDDIAQRRALTAAAQQAARQVLGMRPGDRASGNRGE